MMYKSMKMVAAVGTVVGMLGLGGCASTNSTGYNPAFTVNKDRVVYMRVFWFQDEFGFGYEDAVKNLCDQGDSRCRNYKDYMMVGGMPANSYWGGNIKFYSMVPRGVTVKKGDILEIRLPDLNRPTYFLRVVSHENEPDPACKWEGVLTSGGVVCPKLGYDYRKHLGFKGMKSLGGYETYTPEPYTPPSGR